jgi:hypothetical protein
MAHIQDNPTNSHKTVWLAISLGEALYVHYSNIIGNAEELHDLHRLILRSQAHTIGDVARAALNRGSQRRRNFLGNNYGLLRESTHDEQTLPLVQSTMYVIRWLLLTSLILV